MLNSDLTNLEGVEHVVYILFVVGFHKNVDKNVAFTFEFFQQGLGLSSSRTVPYVDALPVYV